MSKNEMIMLPREVVEQALEALREAQVLMERFQDEKLRRSAMKALRAALEQPKSNPVPYLWYDPENGDTLTQEAINDGCCPPDDLIALYTK